MALHDYSNPGENIIFAPLEENLFDHNGNEFTVVGSTPIFHEDAVVGKYVEIPEKSYLTIDNDGLAVGTGDFTLDFWAYSIGKNCVVSTVTPNTGVSIYPYLSYSQYRRQSAYLGTFYQGEFINMPNFKSMEWAHYAFTRKDGVCYAFVNGVLQGKVDSTRNMASNAMSVNADSPDTSIGLFCDLNNYYKAVRFCNFARWTEDFAPPVPDEGGGIPSVPIDMKLYILLKVGQTVNLTGHMYPLGANPAALVWSSENDAIASVDQNGTVTAKAAGKTKILVQTVDGSWSAFARIKVVEEGEDELLLSILLEVGESCLLFPEFEPEEAQTAVLWSSSDAAIATVNAVGKVTGLVPGLVVITAKTADNKLTDSMYVTVNA